MFKKSSKVLAAVLAAAMVFTGAAVGATGSSVDAQAAAKTKVSMVTKASNNDGDSIKYTYNKKGLVSKIVATNSYKTTTTDVKTTKTTKFTYNKKNYVTAKSIVTSTAETSYDTDNTTGKANGVVLGTVTTTTTEDHVYTVNKKGRATKDVVTSYIGMSGSVTETEYTGQSYYDANKTKFYYYDDWDDSNIYYTNDLRICTTVTTTTAYTDNGNGSYTKVVTTETSRPDTKDTLNYDANNKLVSATIELAGTASTTKEVVTTTESFKEVQTNEYTYSKDKAILNNVSTVQNGSESVVTAYDGTSYNYFPYPKTTDGVTTVTWSIYQTVKHTDETKTYEYTNESGLTEKYSYKKGLMSKKVVTNDGTYRNVSKETYTGATGSTKWTYTDPDGTVTVTERPLDYTASVTEISDASGVKSVSATTTENTYKHDGSENHTLANYTLVQGTPSTTTYTDTNDIAPSSYTETFKYDKAGNLASTKIKGTYVTTGVTVHDAQDFELYTYDVTNRKVDTKTSFTTTINETQTFDTEVSEKTGLITSVLARSTYDKDRSAMSGYYLDGRYTYTAKSKKVAKKLADTVEAQQWLIQNSIGLDYSALGNWYWLIPCGESSLTGQISLGL